ncbi:MAG: hypothetical protein ACXWC2_21485 [Ramlibacter sp.]
MFAKIRKAALAALCCIGVTLSCLAQAPDPANWLEVEGGAWTVPAQVRTAMVAALELEAGRHWGTGRRRSLDRYTVQYQGESRDGVRTVRLAGACETTGWTQERLKTAFLRVFDGGTCYFDATWDPVQGRFTGFAFHGYA